MPYALIFAFILLTGCPRPGSEPEQTAEQQVKSRPAAQQDTVMQQSPHYQSPHQAHMQQFGKDSTRTKGMDKAAQNDNAKKKQ